MITAIIAGVFLMAAACQPRLAEPTPSPPPPYAPDPELMTLMEEIMVEAPAVFNMYTP